MILTWDTWAFQYQNLPQWPAQSARWCPDKYLIINFSCSDKYYLMIINFSCPDKYYLVINVSCPDTNNFITNTNIWLSPCGTSLRGWRAWRRPLGCSRRSRQSPLPAPTACLVSWAFWGQISETGNFLSENSVYLVSRLTCYVFCTCILTVGWVG